MKAILLGAGGQLGQELQRALAAWELHPFSHRELDISDSGQVRRVMRDLAPRVAINCAAYTRVDDCEEHVQRAFRVNAWAVRDLARLCREEGCQLVHISTDYVFGGEKGQPYTEQDLPRPLNVYGVSKLAGEHFALGLAPRALVVRSSGLYGPGGEGGNFVEVMLRRARAGEPLRVVEDQVLSPTYTRELARALRQLIRAGAAGLYHVANRGACSWYRFAREIFSQAGLEVDLQPISSAAYGAAARRPAYSALDSGKAWQLLGGPLSPWQEALARYLQERGAG